MRRLPMLVLLALALTACPSGEGGPDEFRGLAPCHPRGLLSVGESLPDCSFRDFRGGVLRLADLKGRPAVLNFWASWCANCIREMPDFQAVADERTGVAVVGFDLERVDGETEALARKFAAERNVTYRLAFDPTGLFYAHFSGRPALPTTIFVKADGRIAHRQFGELDAEALRELIDRHLT